MKMFENNSLLIVCYIKQTNLKKKHIVSLLNATGH